MPLAKSWTEIGAFPDSRLREMGVGFEEGPWQRGEFKHRHQSKVPWVTPAMKTLLFPILEAMKANEEELSKLHQATVRAMYERVTEFAKEVLAAEKGKRTWTRELREKLERVLAESVERELAIRAQRSS